MNRKSENWRKIKNPLRIFTWLIFSLPNKKVLSDKDDSHYDDVRLFNDHSTESPRLLYEHSTVTQWPLYGQSTVTLRSVDGHCTDTLRSLYATYSTVKKKRSYLLEFD